MKSLINCIKAESYKMIHSKLILLHIGVPLSAIIVFIGYYSYSPMDEVNKLTLFIQAVAMVFPFLISIIITMSYEQEAYSESFQYILSAPFSRMKMHLSKMFILLVFGFASSILTVCGFGFLFRSLGYQTYPFNMYVQLSLILYITNLAIYFLQYIIAFTFGNGISLAFGIVGLILSPLLYLVLGDVIWKYIPFGWGIRMSSYFLELKTSEVVEPLFVEEFRAGAINIFLITICCILVYCLWCRNWQGSKSRLE